MNTGFLGPAVATALTVYGIETKYRTSFFKETQLQQHLPFTVLKLSNFNSMMHSMLQQHLPFTVLKLVVLLVKQEVL